LFEEKLHPHIWNGQGMILGLQIMQSRRLIVDGELSVLDGIDSPATG
jgi:hypothetical protein